MIDGLGPCWLCGACHRHTFDACIGATIMLPITSWERRFIDMAQNDDAGKGGGEVGSGEDGSGGGADGVMLISTTHHRYAGLFTIRKAGAPPVTKLLIRGSPAL